MTDTMDTTWDAICRIALAAEELSRCDDYIDAQGANILRDAGEAIDAAIWKSLLRRMRQHDEGVPGPTGVGMALPEASEDGRARLREPDDTGRESAAVSPM